MLKIKMIMAALLAIGFASSTFAEEEGMAPPAKRAKVSAKASAGASGGKWTAAQCNENCTATTCLTKTKLVECANKCKATPMQIWNCTGAGYKKNCMKPDMSENIKSKECAEVSYALSAQAFRIWSSPVSSKATPDLMQAASEATGGKLKVTAKHLNHLTSDELKLPEVMAIMSREAKAGKRVSSIDDENDGQVAG